jgi:hypothetical protein
MSTVQLIAIKCDDGRYHYGEISGLHIFKSNERQICSSALSRSAPSEEWIRYVKGKTFDIETTQGWKKTYVTEVRYTVIVTATGYNMPALLIHKPKYVTGYPEFLIRQHFVRLPAPPPVPPPPAVRARAPPVPAHAAAGLCSAIADCGAGGGTADELEVLRMRLELARAVAGPRR